MWQCCYGGVEVSDELWTHVELGRGQKYADNQAERLPAAARVLAAFDEWTGRFVDHVRKKGKVEPGRWRAFGHRAPGHRLADARLEWRDLRRRFGHPRAGSSPAMQQELGLDRDATLHPGRGEGERLREPPSKP